MNLNSDSVFIEKLSSYFKEVYTPEIIIKDEKSVTSSVALIIRNNNNIYEILFIKRSERDNDNFSGHMAFPGWTKEEKDKTGFNTAVRETLEEVGLDLDNNGLYIGKFSDYRPVDPKSHHFIVSPYIFYLKDCETKININTEEVEDVVWIDLKILEKLSIKSKRTTKKYNELYQDYVFNYKGYNIWGMTGKMLFRFLQEIKNIK